MTIDPTMKNLYSMGTVNIGNNPVATPTSTNIPNVQQSGSITNTYDPAKKTYNYSDSANPTNPATNTNLQTPTTPGATPNVDASGNVKNLYGDPTMNDLYSAVASNYANIYKAPQETQQEIRDRKLREIQAEIDATNTVYASKLQSAKVQGANRLGQGTAIQARRGLIGSDFGSAQTDNINTANNDIYNNIEAEKAAAVQSLIEKANNDATAEFEKKTAARESGLKDYLTFLQGEETRKSTKASDLVASLIASNIDPTTLPKTGDGSIEDLAKSYGLTPDKLFTQYSTAKKASDAAKAKSALETAKTQSEIDKANIFNVAAGQKVYKYDPKTGKTEVIAYNPKAATSTGGSGSGNGGYYGGQYTPGGKGSPEDVKARVATIPPAIRGYAEAYLKTPSTLSSIPKGVDRNAVVAASQTIAEEKGINTANNMLYYIDRLLSPDSAEGVSNAFGTINSKLPTLRGNTANVEADIGNITALATLDNIGLMKGTGPLSDRDMATVAKASSELQASKTPEAIRAALVKMQTELEPARFGQKTNKNPYQNQQQSEYTVGQEVEINGTTYRVVDDAGNLEEI